MQYDACDEAISKTVAKPAEMSGGIAIRRRAGLDFDRDDLSRAEFSKYVHLVATLLLPEVVQPRSGFRYSELSGHVRSDERVEDAAKKVSVS